MDITQTIASMKKDPEFAANVGMVMAHNGVVRAWSRKDHQDVGLLDVTSDQDKVEALRREYAAKPGIYKILVEARTGRFKPGDDLLFIIVAGDVREHVAPILVELLNRIKSEAITKKEIAPGE